ncbi:MAG TPA: hypothetical protein VF277_00510, partial [Steroidobacteraceae bacterium]
MMAVAGAAATAQSVLPTVERALPKVPGSVEIDPTAIAVTSPAAARIRTVRNLLSAHRATLETDPHGEVVRRHEILALVSSDAVLETARGAGFVVRQHRVMGSLGDLYVLEVPVGTTTRVGLQRL